MKTYVLVNNWNCSPWGTNRFWTNTWTL